MLTDANGALANENTGKLTKADLIEEVSRVTALHWQEAASIVECILDSIVHAIERGDKVEIRGFGSFRIRQRGGRVARNPKTGARVEVPPRRIPVFKPSKELRELVDQINPDRSK